MSIRAKHTGRGLELTVSDDGVGLNAKASDSRDTRAHVGVENIKKRLQTAYNGRASFTLRPREGGGTEAVVLIEKEEAI